MAVAAMVAVTTLFLPVAAGYIAVAVALVGGVIACSLAWREARLIRAAAMSEAAATLRESGERLHAERQQHAKVLHVLQERNADLRNRLSEARAEGATLMQKVSSLRGDIASLRLDLARSRAAQDAEVLALPRRVSGPPTITGEELWNEGNVPTVVDLQALSAPFVEEVIRHHA